MNSKNPKKNLRPLSLLSLSLALGAGFVLALLWALGGAVRAAPDEPAVLYVAPSGSDAANDCTLTSHPCATIQHAVDLAAGGDEIRVAALDVSASLIPPRVVTVTARYTGTGDSVVVLTKSLTLRGGYVYAHGTGFATWTAGTLPALVDGEQARRTLYVSGNVSPTLRALAFANGHAERGGNVYAEGAHLRFVTTLVSSGTATYGGGLYLKNCSVSIEPGGTDWQGMLGVSSLMIVRGNVAQYGGGLYVEGGLPVLAGLGVFTNSATADGGGIYLNGGAPVVIGGLVLENQAGQRGGGVFLKDSLARVAAAGVYSNTASDGAGFYLDGSLSFSSAAIPVVANNYVRYNRAANGRGGGFYFYQAAAGLVNNVVADNQAQDGAAMYLWASSPQVVHNTLARNAGESAVYLAHQAGQVWPPVVPIPSLPAFTNTIVASHTLAVYVESTGLIYPLQNRADMDGTLWWGNGQNNGGSGELIDSNAVEGDPRFTCTGNLPDCLLPYHIQEGSAALDAGVDVALALPGTDLLVDIDGQLRPSGAGYDVGADEVVSETYGVWLVPPLSSVLAAPGEVVTHTHWLLNTGLQTDTYDLALSSSSGWASLGSASAVTLGAQVSTLVQVRVVVPLAVSSTLSDVAVLTATSRAPDGGHARALDLTQVISGAVDVAVSKSADVDAVNPGAAVRYTLIVSRSGVLDESLPVTLTDRLVPTRAMSAWQLPAGCAGSSATGRITCTWSLPGGQPLVTRTFEVVVTTSQIYTGLLINTATIAGGMPDLDLTNNVSQVTVGVQHLPLVYLPLVMKSPTY